MGSTASTTYSPTDIVNAAYNYVQSTKSLCSITNETVQKIEALKAVGDIIISCHIIDIRDFQNKLIKSGDYSCIQSAVSSQDIKNSINKEFKGVLNNSAEGGSDAKINIGSYSYTNNEINTMIDNFAQCINTTKNDQSIEALTSGGSIIFNCENNGKFSIAGLKNSAVDTVISKCTQDFANDLQSDTHISTVLDPNITNAAVGLSTENIIIIVCCILGGLFLIAIIVYFVKKPPSPPRY
jgi:hypothetical protein